MKIGKIIGNITAKKNTLRTQLLIVLISVALIPVIAISASTYITTIGKITDLSLNTLKTNSYNTKNNIDVKINSIDSIIKGVSSQPGFLVALEMVNNSKNLDTDVYSNVQISMKNAVDGSNKLVGAMYLCDSKGRIVAAGAKDYRQFKDKSFYDLKLFEDIKKLKDGVVVGEPVYSEELKKLVIPISKPVRSLAAFSGSITALVDYNNFFTLISNSDGKSEIIILNKDQTIIYHQNSEKLNTKITDKNLNEYLAGHSNAEYITYNDQKIKKVMYTDKSAVTNWIVCAQTGYSAVMSSVRQYVLVISIVILLTLVITLFVSIIYSKYISKPVVELAEQMKKIEEGCFEISPGGIRANIQEINSLKENFYNMAVNLKNLILNISSASNEIDGMSGVMYEASCSSIEQTENTRLSVNKINENIKKQAENTNLVAEGIDSLANQIATSRELSQNVYGYLDLLNKSTENGRFEIDSLESISGANLKNTDMMKEAVLQLQSQMKQINNVTDTIHNIAKQTHLLSLNATIEASRAGAAGKGFSVVAQEIKGLSEQTNVQTGVIRNMLDGIVKNTFLLVAVFKEVSAGTDTQSRAVSRTKQSFAEIAGCIENINHQLYNINDYLREMDSQKTNLVQLVNHINLSAAEIAAGSNQVQSYTQEQQLSVNKLHDDSDKFKELAGTLKKSVEIFKV